MLYAWQMCWFKEKFEKNNKAKVGLHFLSDNINFD